MNFAKFTAVAIFTAGSIWALPQWAAADGFTDITEASGINKVVDAQYAAAGDRGLWLSGMDLIDLDGDGKLDLFLSAHNGKAIAAINDGKGKFAVPADLNIPTSEVHVAYDINNDGKLDLVMTDNDGGGRWWLNQSTPGHLSFKKTDIYAVGGQARQNAMIDINKDGNVDWLHEGGKTGTTTWDQGDGKGMFTPTKTNIIKADGWKDGPGILPVDLNGDGNIDIIFSKRGYDEDKTGRTRVFFGDGKLGFTDVTKDSGLDEEGLQIMGVGDFNHDGTSDIICLEKGKSLTVYLNDGKGKFTKLEGAISGINGAGAGEANWGMAVAVDLDNDGHVDVMMNGRSFLHVFKGSGDGHFAYVNKVWGINDYADAAVDAGICFGDIDGDGMLDVLAFKHPEGKEDRRVIAYHNDLPKQNWINVRPIGAAGNKAAAGAKIRITEGGKLLEYEQVGIWARQVCRSYYSFLETERHFGLGTKTTADISVEFYPSGKKVEMKGVKAGTTIEVKEPGQ